MSLLKGFAVVACLALTMTACEETAAPAANETNKPGTSALALGKQMYTMRTTKEAEASAHKGQVADGIQLAAATQTLKEMSHNEWKGTVEVKDKTVCYIKWSNGDDSGVVPRSSHDCENKSRAERAMKKANEWVKEMKPDEDDDSNRSEARVLKSIVPGIAQTMVSNPDIDLPGCIEDVSAVLSNLQSQVLAEECSDVPSGDEIKDLLGRRLKSSGLVNDDWSYKSGGAVEEAKDAAAPVADKAPDDEEDAEGDEEETEEADPKKDAVEGFVKWIESVDGAEARIIAGLDSGDTACLDKLFFENAAVKALYGTGKALSICAPNLSK